MPEAKKMTSTQADGKRANKMANGINGQICRKYKKTVNEKTGSFVHEKKNGKLKYG